MTVSHQLIERINTQNKQELISDGLMDGKLGMVYYYFNLYEHSKEDFHLLKIEEYLEIIFQNIETSKSDLLLKSTLENGLSGLGFILQLLVNANLLGEEYKKEINEIKLVVCNEAIRLLEHNNYDFINGPFGILFFLNFVEDKESIDKILSIIEAKIKKEDNFFFYNKAAYIEGIHIGYAHGICAIIAVLNTIENEKADVIITFLLKKLIKIIKDNDYSFNNKKYYLPRSIHKEEIVKGELNFRPVLAWSNSDINFSTLIFSLKKKFVNKELIHLATTIALDSIERKEIQETAIEDYRFFYGSSGVLKSYHYLYLKTGNSQFKEAAFYWYSKTLDYLEKDTIKEHPLNFINNLPATTLTLLEFEQQKNNNWSKIVLL
ncbi:conserved hypothetical protein [Flavobacterium sp. 9AF]|uniref:lanthionine synthetase LanC family protein n=1 Tax=Flavobacterium sp. 9AF TaxID=2653142 RepID=UPI0012F3A964|nr:lanthionine synthetase LanC family protein [Flavobacterium sp. 9AF]VXB33654.1 conserved hypothetical protein [Flavobacterium sp. 9AF]